MSMSVAAWFFLGLAVILAMLLWVQARQRDALSKWLDAPDRQSVPEGRGVWGGVFSRLQRMRKEDMRAQAALAERLDRFHQAAQALPDGVILLDTEGHIDWLNEAACRYFDLNASDDIGTLVEQLIRQTAFVDYLTRYRAGADMTPLILQRENAAGGQTLSVMLLSFATTGTLLLARDISEITRAETMRRDFIANVSHELRTPLTVIAGFLEHLSDASLLNGDTAMRFIALMTEQSQRMNRLVEDLLTLSRLENTQNPPRDDEIDVSELLNSLLNEANALSQGRHRIEITYICECRLRGSRDELRSAFGNLLSNAVRYTQTGGTISLSFEGQGAQLAFSVTDTGIGIPAEHIPRLTERFYRVDKGRSTESGGTGLGLAIVKHVLARHQGSLSIRSKPGQGSTFTAHLPAERKI